MLEALIQGFNQADPDLTQNVVRSNPTVDKALTNVFGVSSPAAADNSNLIKDTSRKNWGSC